MSQPIPDLPTACWPVDWSCVDDIETHDPVVVARAESLATSSLRMLTLYAVGNCPETVRPCTCPSRSTWSNTWMTPHIDFTGSWVNVCTVCDTLTEITLPGPIASVEEVIIDGVQVDPSAYRVDNGNLLVRTDGEPWPSCQDMAASPGEDGTFTVTYTRGVAVDGMAAFMAGLLGREFLSICEGGDCGLPATVTAVTRQGVTFEMPTGAFPNGRTGIMAIDTWLAQFNPYGVRRPATVSSVDVRRPRQTTWSPA
jgi:hypothetical protein